MPVPDHIEAVSKVSETVRKEGGQAEEAQRVAPNKERFDSLMNAQNTSPSSDIKAFQTEPAENLEKTPTFDEENVSSQQSGSSTDQQHSQKKREQQEEIEAVSGPSEKRRQAVQGQTNALMDEVSKLNSEAGNLKAQGPEAIKKQAQETISKLEEIKTRLSDAKADIKPAYHTILKNRLSHIDDSIKIALNKAGLEYSPADAAKIGSGDNLIRKFINMVGSSQRQIEHLSTNIDALSGSKAITPAVMLSIQMKMNFVTQQVELFSNILNKALESTKTIMNVQV